MSDIATKGAKRKLPRPNGVDQERYKNCDKWSYRRWAWEFLRRNPKFIAACNQVRVKGDAEKQQVADEYGLVKFKDYREAYSSSGLDAPRFTLGKLTIKSNLGSGQDSKTVKQIKVGEGQVGVLIDLNHALQDANALKKQLRLVGKVLQDRLTTLENTAGKKAKPAKFKPSLFLEYIRILDCLAAGHSQPKIAQLLFPQKAGADRDALIDIIKPKIRSAKEHSMEKYPSIALLPSRPIAKKK